MGLYNSSKLQKGGGNIYLTKYSLGIKWSEHNIYSLNPGFPGYLQNHNYSNWNIKKSSQHECT